jgi:hypothetical protein
MAPTRFADRGSIESAVLHEMLDWFDARCTAGAWPPVSAFRAETIPPRVLPHIGRVVVSSDPLRVYYRAVGSAISDSLGVEMSGRYLDELGIPQAAGIAEWYRLSLAAPDPIIVRGEQNIDGQTFVYEGCCLPLGTPADEPRHFIICTDFLNTEAWQTALRRRRYDRPV